MIGLVFDHLLTIGIGIVAFIAGGLLMPQSIRDKFSGVSPELRTAINLRLAAVQKDIDYASQAALSTAVNALTPQMPASPQPTKPFPAPQPTPPPTPTSQSPLSV